MKIKKNSVILFEGDSVTDCGRREDVLNLGKSYVRFVSEEVEKYGIKVINRAISGSKIGDLNNRFNDVKEIKPDYISILIGVNDTWHGFPNSETDEVFKEDYEKYLKSIKDELNIPIIMIEPFIVGNIKEYTNMRHDLLNKIEIIRELAKKYASEYISFESVFTEALIFNDQALYTIEGIHPLYQGYLLMAKHWLEKMEFVD